MKETAITALGFGMHQKINSCMECPSQEGCAVAAIWGRLQTAIPALIPKFKIFKDKTAIEESIARNGYEAGTLDEGEIKKGDTPFCAAFFMNATKGKESVDVTIKLNASSTIVDLGMLDKVHYWDQGRRYRSFNNYLASLPREFLSLQNYIEKFMLEKAGYETNSTDPLIAPFPTDESVRLGIAVKEPELFECRKVVACR